MATLEVEIETKLDVVLIDPIFDDVDRTEVASFAAAYVKSHLGNSVDGDDIQALEVGVRYAAILIKKWYALATDEITTSMTDLIDKQLIRLARSRRQSNSAPVVGSKNNDDINNLYPYLDPLPSED